MKKFTKIKIMKKILLGAALALLATIGNAQVIAYVEAPSPNEGNYDFTYASGTTWASPDLTDPLNAVSGIMCFADDGTPADSLACNPLINTLTGNVAVLYRGSCEFGLKAFNAQTAGAIAVIIINNAAGAPVAMGGGADGLNVTIPVIMVSNTTGALLRDEILACNTSIFIGSKNGLYPNDLGIAPGEALIAKSFTNVQLLSQNASEFDVEIGAWVRNYGSNDQTGITLNCMIDLGVANLYNETSAAFDLISGDSIFISLPLFSQSTYANGYYDMAYTVMMTPIDESTYDNVRETDFAMSDTLWSYSRVDAGTWKPITETDLFHTTPWYACMAFQDPNASRIGIRGVNFSAGTSQNPTPTSLDGENVEIFVFEWTNVFTDNTDLNPQLVSTSMSYNQLTATDYVYTADLQGQNVYVPFTDNLLLEDDVRYLFCTKMQSTTWPGYDTKVDYLENLNYYNQPIVMGYDDGTEWFHFGAGSDKVPAMSINFFDALSVGLVELPKSDIVAYPNPASDIINVPLGKVEGNVNVTIIDINGRTVNTQNTTSCSSMLTIDVTSLATGIYTLKLVYENGTSEAIQVVINR